MSSDSEGLIREQIDYYRNRAPEYDDWFFRRGRYDRGPDWNRGWFREVEEVREALRAFAPSGRVLELACGTGLWTEQLAATGAEITAVDSAAETIAINRRRLGAAKVRYVQADVFDWQSKQPFDCVFFGFWLSHVPPDRFETFWRSLGSHLKPEGRFFFVDNAHNPSSVPIDSRRSGGPAWRQTRQLGDGREFDIVKIFYQPEALAARLRDLGWQAEVRKTANHFLLAWGSRGGGGSSLE